MKVALNFRRAGYAACIASGMLAVFVAAVCCPVVNTGVFLLGCQVFFLETITEWGKLYGFESVGAYMIFGLTGLNFLIELGVDLVLAPVAARLIKIGKK